ncbi:GrpB family protein [Priestia taiwanensis]|uniref:GrpB family protein n=1 Tax=Priestia taiwanensis TaxID=1347902 RepID=A0A917AKS5_9BACI|nr:GrpB family protein [Priestia taiwanensis]MBM7362116.1 GrpB-like predicted nucleotidyltransferase (UPF0157 family) [Priestia taiwanensis]GGE59597.1 hypothetical protein GCM10007140_07400 [Priestia taiwanensis]
MECVHFLEQTEIKESIHSEFSRHKLMIMNVLPHADIQHVGSTAIPYSITKGDLDIQVRVWKKDFEKAVEMLSTLYDVNEGSTETSFFKAFQDDTLVIPVGVQLTVIDSELDIFWKIRDTLLTNDELRVEYDNLKRTFEGKSMEAYREAKDEFLERVLAAFKWNI